MLTRRFSPPEHPRCCVLPMRVSAHSLRPSSRMTSSTTRWRSRADVDGGRRRSAEYCSVSRTVSVGSRTSCCMTYACRTPCTPATPLKVVTPASLRRELLTRSAMVLSSVVLPDPLPPMMAVRVPGWRSASTACSRPLMRGVVLKPPANSSGYVVGSSHDGDVLTETERLRMRTSTASTSASERLPAPEREKRRSSPRLLLPLPLPLSAVIDVSMELARSVLSLSDPPGMPSLGTPSPLVVAMPPLYVSRRRLKCGNRSSHRASSSSPVVRRTGSSVSSLDVSQIALRGGDIDSIDSFKVQSGGVRLSVSLPGKRARAGCSSLKQPWSLAQGGTISAVGDGQGMLMCICRGHRSVPEALAERRLNTS